MNNPNISITGQNRRNATGTTEITASFTLLGSLKRTQVIIQHNELCWKRRGEKQRGFEQKAKEQELDIMDVNISPTVSSLNNTASDTS